MLKNDEAGDCTCAGWGHLDYLFTTLAGHGVCMTDDEVIAMYVAITGLEGAAGAITLGITNETGSAMAKIAHMRRTLRMRHSAKPTSLRPGASPASATSEKAMPVAPISAQAALPFTLIAVAPVRPDTVTGVFDVVVVPLPSWP